MPQWFLQLSAVLGPPLVCDSVPESFGSAAVDADLLVPVSIAGLHSVLVLLKQKVNELAVTFSIPNSLGP